MTLSPRLIKRAARDVLIKASFDNSKKRNGARCIQQDLADNCKADIKTSMDSMSRQLRLPTVTISIQSRQIYYTANAANLKWAGFITYLYTC